MEKYTLVITEKPDAAKRIAFALDASQNAKKMNDNGVPYYVARRDGEIVVVPALGHLYTVSAERKECGSYPVFNLKWVPRFIAERRADRVRAWLDIIAKLSRNADRFIDACDYDIEGSVIGYCILKYACGGKEKASRRMKFSTLIKEELERSYVEALPHLDFPLIEAGKTRHEVDWLYGINLSRALTLAAKKWSGRYRTLSTGRVQGPLLNLLVLREMAIRSFVPAPYWQIKAQVELDGQALFAYFSKGMMKKKTEAEALLTSCTGTGRIEKVRATQFQELPPVPFDLGSLQVEAYEFFKYSPKKTLDIAQSLYINALISYPRTSSQKLSPMTDCRSILKSVSNVREYESLTADILAKPVLKPHQGSREDPAHPAIYPTGKLPEHFISQSERNIWDIVVRRFLAVFGQPAIKQGVRANISINGHIFNIDAKKTLQRGWLKFYAPYVNSRDTTLPLLREGQPVEFKKIILESKCTKPPPRYNPSTLLQEMEDLGIGTNATRAEIIQTLYKRKYVQNERMTVTDLGFEVYGVLKSHCPKVVSTKLTKELENRMNRVRQNREKKEDVLSAAIEVLKPALKEFKRNELEIGKRLSDAFETTMFEENVIGECPICSTGRLLVVYSKRTGKRFVGCSNHFKELCNTSFALPQRGSIKLHKRNCPGCGWPTVGVQTGRRTWTLCFNPDCILKQEKIRKKELRCPTCGRET